MLGFHIDLNTHNFTRRYLEDWLKELASLGYDTIIWEIENAVALDAIPDCAAPEAFSKDEFRELLQYSRTLGLDAIPLLQTLGHVEYILQHEPYQHLAEIPGSHSQFCPLNKKLPAFIGKLVSEYLDLFGEVSKFHIGLDETWWLGKCPHCAEFVKKKSYSELYIQYVNKIAAPLIQKKITPIIWADMALTHPEALDKLSRDIMLFDWDYWSHQGMQGVHVWGLGGRPKPLSEYPAEIIAKINPFLFPDGDEPGRMPDAFWKAQFLAAQGFKVVTCPSSASSGDSVFTPRNRLHLVNTFDSLNAGSAPNLEGSVLTSWTVRIHPWEYQRQIIGLPYFRRYFPEKSLNDYELYFCRSRLGLNNVQFFKTIGKLSIPCFLSDSHKLGITKDIGKIPVNTVEKLVNGIPVKDVDEMLKENRARLAEYRSALDELKAIRQQATRGKRLIDEWILAARNLINRAEAAIFLLVCRKDKIKSALAEKDDRRAIGGKILKDMAKLKSETDWFYVPILKPARRKLAISWIYDSVEAVLKKRTGLK